MKDDSGTMEFIKAAVKESENQPLRDRLNLVKNTFLTHRRMGESEGYYRLIPSLHLTDSNIATTFVHTGFNKSRFLKALSPEESKGVDPSRLIHLNNNDEECYIETPSIRDKYQRRPKVLEYITLSQFAKRYVSERVSAGEKKAVNTVDKSADECPESNSIHEDFVINSSPEHRTQLPNLIELQGDPLPGESKYLRLRRKPLVLRFHKFKKTTNPHEFFFAEMELYRPFRKSSDIFIDDFEQCERLYQHKSASINYVKSRVMEFLEQVEESREVAQDQINEEIANQLDAEGNQDNDDLNVETDEEPTNFIALDSEVLPNEKDAKNDKSNDGFYKIIEIQDLQTLKAKTDALDKDQKYVINKGISYAKDLVKWKSRKFSPPVPPLLAIQGGAGSGKSHMIDLLAQWIEFTLRSSGDHPNHPFVIKCAFAGTAAAKIGGQTITSAFNIGFGNKFQSLPDKTRDLKRGLLSNLSMLIIDEYSMVKSDMLYQLDLRLKELKQQPDIPFGNVSVFLVGDLLQLSPVKGRYLFQSPVNEAFDIYHSIAPLWKSFDPIVLRENHRQGEDKMFADILNRIARGIQTKEDLDLLSHKIVSKDSPLPDDALYIFSLNADVNETNDAFLDKINQSEVTIDAIIRHSTIKNYKPLIERDGSIKGTPLQSQLKLKVGAEIMLTYNLDTCDGLTNGAFGKVIGFEYYPNKSVKNIIIEFYNSSVGKDKRNKFPEYKERYLNPLATPIGLHESHYNVENKFSSATSKAIAINFPLKLSFAVTAHKVQGQTVSKPKSVVTDLKRATFAGQAHVMLSRAECLDQLIILDELFDDKWRVSKDALEIVEEMENNAINILALKSIESKCNIVSLNIHSLSNLKHFVSDNFIEYASLICLQETWHNPDKDNAFCIKGFDSHFNSGYIWQGNGICNFYKPLFTVEQSIWAVDFQITKMSAKQVSVINVYWKGKSETTFLIALQSMVSDPPNTILLGDFNYNITEVNKISSWLSSICMVQKITKPSQIQGGIIDHVWIPESMSSSVEIRQSSPYYSDHDMIILSIDM